MEQEEVSKDMKKVLITGANSYIGTSFEKYANEHYSKDFSIDTIDMKDSSWRDKDFSNYDIVYHVAGIAHADVGNVDEATKRKYYEVNTKLAIDTCKKARAEGVKQFVFMSSAIIYGDSAPIGKRKRITKKTKPRPSNFYGDSKWRADKGVRKLADDNFTVTVLRPPMIYGKGSKGNYPTLSKMAKKLPIFPDIKNERSMLYIENLCEFLCQIMIRGEGGIFWPQNAEYSNTSELVKMIARAHNHKICVSKLWNVGVGIATLIPGKPRGLANKAFGNMCYDQKLSSSGFEYQLEDLITSIDKTENSKEKSKTNNRILLLVNHDVVIYNFRLELVEKLVQKGYEVHISSPVGMHTDELREIGVHFHVIDINRHGMNPMDELKIIKNYRKIMKSVKPLIVFTYTVKCNVYGGIVARYFGIPFCANITGLGMTINGGGIKEKIVLDLYKVGLRDAQRVFFQNNANKDYMLSKGVINSPHTVLPGSGVNLKRHCYEPYPQKENPIVISYIGRIMKDKGIGELLKAAKIIRKKNQKVKIRLIGFFDDEYEYIIKQAESKGVIEYISQQRDIHPWIVESHAIIMPSYHEGMSNVLLEAASTGRPVIATDIPGCIETFDDRVSGIAFKPRNTESIVEAIEVFLKMSREERVEMGKAGRKKMENEFSRTIVVDKYMEEINKLGATI